MVYNVVLRFELILQDGSGRSRMNLTWFLYLELSYTCHVLTFQFYLPETGLAILQLILE